jgi:DnaJ homolog subfamily C member 19
VIKLLFFVGLVALAAWLVIRAIKPPRMPRTEAAKLLGVAPDAGSDAILEAHRRLIAKVHPDTGGSAELAARINEARDTLLKP